MEAGDAAKLNGPIYNVHSLEKGTTEKTLLRVRSSRARGACTWSPIEFHELAVKKIKKRSPAACGETQPP